MSTTHIEKIEPVTKEELEKQLNRIGWSFKGRYPNQWIFDDKGHKTKIRVMGDRLEVEGVFEESFTGSVLYSFRGSNITIIDSDTVSFGTDHNFINFYGKALEALTP